MKKVKVDVCVCTSCVMSGAMEILESLENLRDLRDKMQEEQEIQVTTNPQLEPRAHTGASPMVSVNEQVFKKATIQEVLSAVMQKLEHKK